ncbi:hypothetical protein HSB1_45000 [Halogranum salarium B-1]|uniref:Uncharacterized protein n=2 Tax=Halogranum rubrum TaxID=553466 RepID=J3JD23_9EURY|nr:hypothetical protein HSB1_45000 [Halogranum salarium B-1]
MERGSSSGRRLTDPEQYTLRGPVEKQVVQTPSDDDETEDDRADERRWRSELVTSRDAADSLTFGDVDGVDGARAFLDETDFRQETVYIEQRIVEECWDTELCYVTWGPEKIETDYSRTLRPVDAACSTDQEDIVVSLVRIPEALDPKRVTQHGSSMGGRCRVPPDSRDNGANESSAAEGTDVEVTTETAEESE